MSVMHKFPKAIFDSWKVLSNEFGYHGKRLRREKHVKEKREEYTKRLSFVFSLKKCQENMGKVHSS